jgi:glycerol uptake facilitator protein
MSPFLGELIGTMLLILLGDGVVANILLTKSKGQDLSGGWPSSSGWMVITTGWGLAVFVGVYAVASVSGAHINPAVSIGLAVAGSFPWADVPGYIVAQFIGAVLGAVLVWLTYLPHWSETSDAVLKRAVFCTVPQVRNIGLNTLTEIIGTFALMFGVFVIKGPQITFTNPTVGIGALGAIPVAFLVWAIGLSLGGPTGYAINPARDLGPRIAHAILPIPGKADNDWSYGLVVPIFGPLIGSILAALLYMALGKF